MFINQILQWCHIEVNCVHKKYYGIILKTVLTDIQGINKDYCFSLQDEIYFRQVTFEVQMAKYMKFPTFTVG